MGVEICQNQKVDIDNHHEDPHNIHKKNWEHYEMLYYSTPQFFSLTPEALDKCLVGFAEEFESFGTVEVGRDMDSRNCYKEMDSLFDNQS